MQYAYRCPACGPLDFDQPLDAISCRCGRSAKRIRRFAIGTAQARKDQGGWNPVVGQYVANDAEFRSVLAAQVERESESMGMTCKVALVDSRDKEGLAELHGDVSVDHYHAEAENTAKHLRDTGAVV